MRFNTSDLARSLPTPEYTPVNSPTSSPVQSTFEIPLTIAITGSAGLVGSGLVRLALKEGHTVLALDIVPPDHHGATLPKNLEFARDRYEYKQVSALDYNEYKEALDYAGCNAIVHLATLGNGPDLDVRLGKGCTGKAQYEVHNSNVAMSCNTLSIAGELGINRVVLASSVNSIGLLFSRRPTFDYLPLDENHPCRPEDAYSMSKYFCELQSDSYVRRFPKLRVASLRFHGVVKDAAVDKERLDAMGGEWKDLWGWVSSYAVSKACLLGLTAPTRTFREGTHETFFIVAPTICQQSETLDLVKQHYPEIIREGRLKRPIRDNESLFDCSKARRMLGWHEQGFWYQPKDEDSGSGNYAGKEDFCCS
ncbi:uncharacterized protein I303_105609 [Kwoniella dejecticola CBS 10117]|uniref:NAD-dependent epimerase/dehydratase domain-containing protein n=1 Tax=Kwoniella dejecticola CBS 10117 TaxID=1296121 RepID=A0A1A6A200_9TREE|nr:uncharacterized protein I303_04948 [Kwoniella dejecticola CBS 10117]OBR84091.1 hypothetical protein I303_04948 [Kwoniella dejecticola CBS 10117]